MNSPEKQKAELQPVHRIFLGELFVFVFFFAGAMSVLVGPLSVPVATAGMTIGAAVVLSGLCFLWLAFTTPMRKVEPRYEFLVLSLLPGLLICVGVLGYLRMSDASKRDPEQAVLHPIILSGPIKLGGGKLIGSTTQLFIEERLAIEEELKVLGFEYSGFVAVDMKRFYRSGSDGGREVVVFTSVNWFSPPVGPTEYSFVAMVSNIDMKVENKRRFFKEGDPWLQSFVNDLKDRWTKNMEARLKAKGQ